MIESAASATPDILPVKRCPSLHRARSGLPVRAARPVLAPGAAAAIVLLGAFAPPLLAGPFPADIELRRLGETDRLVLDRGGPVAHAGDVNGDGLDDVIVGSGGDTVRVVFGPQRGYQGRLELARVNGASGFAVPVDGLSLAGGGDLNGDGLDDVAVGTADAVHVVYGRQGRFPTNVAPDSLDGTNGFVFEAAGDAVAIVPDTNGDGLDDLVVGSQGADSPGLRDAGRVSIVYGRRGAGPARLGPFNLDGTNGASAYGEGTLALLGWSVGPAGDLNGDGFGDWVLGAPGTDVGELSEAGRAYVVYGGGGRAPVRDLAALDGATGFVFEGGGVETVVGYAARGIGDLNGDGRDDIAIGAPGKGAFGEPGPYPGEAHVVFGGADIPARLDAAALDGRRGFTARGIRGGRPAPVPDGLIGWGDQAGGAVDGAGDINADGVDDLVIGAPRALITDARHGNGEVYVVYGRAAGGFPARLPLASLDGENGFRVIGAGTTDYTGFSVGAAGDFDADGIDDVIFGASGQGESYILYGIEGAVAP